MRGGSVRVCLAILALLVAGVSPVPAQEKSPQPEPGADALEGFFVGFSGIYATGMVTTAVFPQGDPGGGMVPMDLGWRVGVILEYGTSAEITSWVRTGLAFNS